MAKQTIKDLEDDLENAERQAEYWKNKAYEHEQQAITWRDERDESQNEVMDLETRIGEMEKAREPILNAMGDFWFEWWRHKEGLNQVLEIVARAREAETLEEARAVLDTVYGPIKD